MTTLDKFPGREEGVDRDSYSADDMVRIHDVMTDELNDRNSLANSDEAFGPESSARVREQESLELKERVLLKKQAEIAAELDGIKARRVELEKAEADMIERWRKTASKTAADHYDYQDEVKKG